MRVFNKFKSMYNNAALRRDPGLQAWARIEFGHDAEWAISETIRTGKMPTSQGKL